MASKPPRGRPLWGRLGQTCYIRAVKSGRALAVLNLLVSFVALGVALGAVALILLDGGDESTPSAEPWVRPSTPAESTFAS